METHEHEIHAEVRSDKYYFAPSPAKEQEGRGEALFHPVVYFDFMIDDGMSTLVLTFD